MQQKQIQKNVAHVDTSSFALKTNLANSKTEVDKLDIDKLAPGPANLSKLSDVIKNDVVKKTVYVKLVAKGNAIPMNNIDPNDFVLKTKYYPDKTELEKKILDISGLVRQITILKLLNQKIKPLILVIQ